MNDILFNYLRYFWVIGIINSFLNFAVYWFRFRKFDDNDPEVREVKKAITIFTLVLQNIPWIVMGISIMSGSVTSIFQYFRPQDGNIHVTLWFASTLLIFCICGFWVFFKNGAEKMAAHPGLYFRTSFPLAPLFVKINIIVGIVSIIGGFFLLQYLNIPIPEIGG